jgi:hypothetical protein
MSTAGESLGTPPACLVVDASIVIKWHVTEIHTDAARRLLRDDAPALHVPDLVFLGGGPGVLYSGRMNPANTSGSSHRTVWRPPQ